MNLTPVQQSVKEADQLVRIRQAVANGETVKSSDLLRGMVSLYKANPLTKVPLLGMLTLDGKPYSLKDHFPFEPMFQIQRPLRLLWKCARQVAKSTSMSADGIITCATNPFLRMLFITPRFEQIRRLSSNYVQSFVNQALIKPLLVNQDCTQAVLQRSFVSGSTMFFSFAFLDCDRIRGLSVHWINYDEVQDLDPDFLPVIRECMSATRSGGVEVFSGTPKTLDNGIEMLWQKSSKAEWAVPCHSCGYWNLACIQADLIKMIGLHTVVCAKCSNPVNPREGHWYHTEGKDYGDFPAYHVPQIIMPMHYELENKWHELVGKRDGKFNYTKQRFMNEVCGESADFGIKLITLSDIRRASVLGPNVYEKMIDGFRQLDMRVLAVDWGGGGANEISFTTAALMGLNRQTGKVECHYAIRFHAGMDHIQEATALLTMFRETGCQLFCHDFNGSGSTRETLMIQAGMPLERVMGFVYTRASTRDHMVVHKPADRGEMRGYWSLDKTRSLVLMSVSLKSGAILLPEFETSKNVTEDLMALLEDKHDTPGGADILLIRRQPKLPDDFAHSLNFGAVGIWHASESWPDLSLLRSIKLSEEQLNFASPPNGFAG